MNRHLISSLTNSLIAELPEAWRPLSANETKARLHVVRVIVFCICKEPSCLDLDRSELLMRLRKFVDSRYTRRNGKQTQLYEYAYYSFCFPLADWLVKNQLLILLSMNPALAKRSVDEN